jgi:hypothetical protein
MTPGIIWEVTVSIEVEVLAQRLGREVSRHRYAYIVVGSFALAGPFVTRYLFPEAPPFSGLVGGVCLGVYAAMCAIPDQFLDD